MLLNLALEEVLYEKFPSGEKKKKKQKNKNRKQNLLPEELVCFFLTIRDIILF